MGDPFPVVRLRGLPFHCPEEDIKDFFPGLHVAGILRTGRHSCFGGDVFVVFPDGLQAGCARQRAGYTMGIQKVDVVWCAPADFNYAVRQGNADPRIFTPFLRLWGLPFGVRTDDIASFFWDFNVPESMVQIMRAPDGRCTGEAFVQFRTAEEARRALMCKDMMMIGTRHVEIFPAPPPRILPRL